MLGELQNVGRMDGVGNVRGFRVSSRGQEVKVSPHWCVLSSHRVGLEETAKVGRVDKRIEVQKFYVNTYTMLV